jgi:hypothetical protein
LECSGLRGREIVYWGHHLFSVVVSKRGDEIMGDKNMGIVL